MTKFPNFLALIDVLVSTVLSLGNNIQTFTFGSSHYLFSRSKLNWIWIEYRVGRQAWAIFFCSSTDEPVSELFLLWHGVGDFTQIQSSTALDKTSVVCCRIHFRNNCCRTSRSGTTATKVCHSPIGTVIPVGVSLASGGICLPDRHLAPPCFPFNLRVIKTLFWNPLTIQEYLDELKKSSKYTGRRWKRAQNT